MRFFSRVFLPFLLLGYIVTETYLKLQHSSLCDAQGCKLAGELLNFDSIYLNYVGVAGVSLLIILGYLSLKNKFFALLFFMGLYAAIAFETTIISYQYIANPQPCFFCLGILSSLILIALLAHKQSFAVVAISILAIFMGLNVLAVSKNKAFIAGEGNYLIQSETCPHCKKVKTYFAEQNIIYTPISTKEASARNFLKFANITTIPVLLIKEKSSTKILAGDKRIMAYFKTQTTAEKHIATPQTSLQTPLAMPATSSALASDFLGTGDDDAGCAVSIVETEPCADTNSSKKEK